MFCCVDDDDASNVPGLCRGTFYIQYETLEELGEGAFGKAMKCRRRRDNQVFVVKIMHESKMSAKAIEEVCASRKQPACAFAILLCTMKHRAASGPILHQRTGQAWEPQLCMSQSSFT